MDLSEGQEGSGSAAAELPPALLERLQKSLDQIRIPNVSTRVFKEECCISFDTPNSEGGLFVDLASFLAFGREAVVWNFEKTQQAVYLRIQRVAVEAREDERPLKKPSILGIGVEGGFDSREPQYEDQYAIVLLPDFAQLPFPHPQLPEKLRLSVEGVLAAADAERQQQVVQWVAEKRRVSKHAKDLVQLSNGVTVPPTGWQCAMCEKQDNLWLNLSDGTVLCGRRNWDGSGGNNHAVEHFARTRFPLAVKLGTVTADLDAADVFSYEEDDTVEDPWLSQHLQHWGIDFSALKKTEMTTAEREVDQNLNFDWHRIQEKGVELQPLFGPGYTGLANLGNSCYMASVLQVLLSTKPLQERYFHGAPLPLAFKSAPADPTRDFNTQMTKLAHGLLSGKYSTPSISMDGAMSNSDISSDSASSSVPPSSASAASSDNVTYSGQEGISPRMLKALVGEGHVEFSTNRQQDALEFYQHFLDLLQKASPSPASDPTRCFRFRVEERLQCGASGCVSYSQRSDNILSLTIPLEAAENQEEVAEFEKKKRKKGEDEAERTDDTSADVAVRPIVPFAACIESFSAAEQLVGFHSSAINAKTTAYKTTRLASFPDLLVLHMRRYVLSEGWVPKKLDVFLNVPDILDISHLRATGHQPGEQLLPEESASAAIPSPLVADEAIVSQLMGMGFPRLRCERAVSSTANSGAEDAMQWLLDHMDVDDVDLPAAASTTSAAAAAAAAAASPVDEEKVNSLLAFGFSANAARNALQATGGDVERAADWIFNNPVEADLPFKDDSRDQPAAVAATDQVQPAVEDFPDGPGKYRLFAFLSHMGPNTHSGHYVCHIRKDGQWVIFNDAKVAVSGQPPTDMGYLYFYERVHD